MLETRKQIKDYLDYCIRVWRKKRDTSNISCEAKSQADCYVNAFQSVRISIFGETLEKEVRS